ncbi:MAG: hypothetical protein GTO24_04850 [candidate division Zixibacteria bacterium]|nr:hypothetical protein [candidate division Zixibacteria bacterium]
MLYNRHSFRQFVEIPVARMVRLLGFNPLSRRDPGLGELIRAFYDTKLDGQAAPHTDFVSRKEVRCLFKDFTSLRIDVRNLDNLILWKGKISLPHERLLKNVGRVLGLDFHIVATK